ncbi:MAG: 3-isopropylmalate dehydratase small subunit [Pseudomonadota bacterium]
MNAFQKEDGIVVPLDRANVDTDALIPKQFMKSIRRSGFGNNLFDEWRYLDRGIPGADCRGRPRNMAFSLNLPEYQGATILLARDNFGCGSSREHAQWALRDYGIRVIIAPSFGDIFFGNCIKNGLLPVVLTATQVGTLFDAVLAAPGLRLVVDLGAQRVDCPGMAPLRFELPSYLKTLLMEGKDEIDATMRFQEALLRYEDVRKTLEPWLFLR